MSADTDKPGIAYQILGPVADAVDGQVQPVDVDRCDRQPFGRLARQEALAERLDGCLDPVPKVAPDWDGLIWNVRSRKPSTM